MFNFYSVALLHVSAVYSWGQLLILTHTKKKTKKIKVSEQASFK
jgi:hypothetical protein